MKEAREYLQESFASYTAGGRVEREQTLSPDVLSRIVLSEGETEEVRKGALLQLFYHIYGQMDGQRGEEVKAVLKEVLGARIPHALKAFTAGVLCDCASAEPSDQMTDRAADRIADVLVSLILRGSLLYRKELLIALGRTAPPGNAKVTELLRRFLRYGDQHTKHAAARAAGFFGNEGLVPDLVYCLQKETNETVLLPVTEALGRLRSPSSRNALEHVSETFPSETVRQKAREALHTLEQ
ncbi:MAG: HEAT repeat domain-containing protein [Alphaproteobacteria bacterium]|uniref:HEAT repeat domain-containing protein n=1 Tax=Candidatus Nitrobium versatile TaxID=2884831 RepID=A0A953JDW5_9BACT|nr:HEAT repeat domain-containing protein [Candidatus Nitrobium versatile]